LKSRSDMQFQLLKKKKLNSPCTYLTGAVITMNSLVISTGLARVVVDVIFASVPDSTLRAKY
jgi:hypothetical protein